MSADNGMRSTGAPWEQRLNGLSRMGWGGIRRKMLTRIMFLSPAILVDLPRQSTKVDKITDLEKAGHRKLFGDS